MPQAIRVIDQLSELSGVPADIGAESAANKGEPNGYAGLDASGLVHQSTIPDYDADIDFGDDDDEEPFDPPRHLYVRGMLDATRQTTTFDDRELVCTTDTFQLYLGDGETAGGIDVLAGLSLVYAAIDHDHADVYEPADEAIQTHLAVVAGNPHGTSYSDVGAAAAAHNHADDYEPKNSNIQSHISSALNPHGVTYTQAGAAASDHNHTGTYQPVGSYEVTTAKDAASGYAGLNASGHLDFGDDDA